LKVGEKIKELDELIEQLMKKSEANWGMFEQLLDLCKLILKRFK